MLWRITPYPISNALQPVGAPQKQHTAASLPDLVPAWPFSSFLCSFVYNAYESVGVYGFNQLEIAVPQNNSKQGSCDLLPPSRVRPSSARLTSGIRAFLGVPGCIFQMASILLPGPVSYLHPTPSSAGLSQSHLEEKEADKLLPARSQMPVQNEPLGQGQRTGAGKLGASCVCLSAAAGRY